MDHNEITVNEILRHLMHDFLNQMHLIQMNIDMGKPDEAKKLVRKYSQKCSQFFEINNVGLCETNEWLQTATWIYKNLTIEVNATLLNREAQKYDSPLKDYLERFVEAIYPLLRGYQEQVLRVHLNSNDILEIQVELNGEWSSYTWIDESFKGLLRVEKEKNTESQIKFKLFASE